MTTKQLSMQNVGRGERFPRLQNSILRVVSTWAWWFLGAALAALLVLLVNGIGMNMAFFNENPHLFIYIEVTAVGLLPVLFTLICKDDLTGYGFHRRNLTKSLLISLLYVAVMFVIGYLINGQMMSGLNPDLILPFPQNVFYGLAGIVVWGPLEIFFVVWLIENTDDIFHTHEKLCSWGLIITVVIFTLLHIPTSNLTNAAYSGVIFLIVSLIYKKTGNIYGPLLAWTLVNGQVWNMANLLLNGS